MLSGSAKGQGGAPSEIIMKNYPSTAHAVYDRPYDDIEGIDNQINKDVKGGSGLARTKY